LGLFRGTPPKRARVRIAFDKIKASLSAPSVDDHTAPRSTDGVATELGAAAVVEDLATQSCFRLDVPSLPARVLGHMAVSFRSRALAFSTATLSLLFGFLGCPSAASRAPLSSSTGLPAPAAVVVTKSTPAPSAGVPETIFPVMLGIDVLESQGFAAVKGKRIGLLTHAAGVNRRGVSTIEVLRRAPGVKLAVLFAPENGLNSDEESGKNLPDSVDRRTGFPVYSLYGKTRKPTKQMLKGLNALVIDLQDIGVRSYTYASAMRYAMEACFESNVEVIVLDRPNPLGGLKVSGPLLDADLMSYVGAFRVPYVHGLTIGELARMAAAAPGVLAVPETVRLKGRLTVVPMRGWRRSMRWPDTGLTFVPTSPLIQDFAAVEGYPMTGLGCVIGGFSHGIGRSYPFRGLSFKGKTVEQLEKELASLNLSGLNFTRVSAPDTTGKPSLGVYIEVTDWAAWQPADLSFHLMRLACKWSPVNPFASATADKAAMFNKLVGSAAWWNALKRNGAKVDVERFLAEWRKQAQIYQQQSRRYWLYPE
jgi:uncharacterized protein YbbC (DUF1343 family)